MAIDGVTFFLAALGETGSKTSIRADVRFGVVYIWRRKPLLWLLSTFAVVNLCLPLGVLAGGVLVSAWGGAKRKRVVVPLLSILAVGLFQVGMALSPFLFWAAAAALAFNFTAPMSNARSQAIWQSLGPLSQVLAGWQRGVVAPGTALAIMYVPTCRMSAALPKRRPMGWPLPGKAPAGETFHSRSR